VRAVPRRRRAMRERRRPGRAGVHERAAAAAVAAGARGGVPIENCSSPGMVVFAPPPGMVRRGHELRVRVVPRVLFLHRRQVHRLRDGEFRRGRLRAALELSSARKRGGARRGVGGEARRARGVEEKPRARVGTDRSRARCARRAPCRVWGRSRRRGRLVRGRRRLCRRRGRSRRGRRRHRARGRLAACRSIDLGRRVVTGSPPGARGRGRARERARVRSRSRPAPRSFPSRPVLSRASSRSACPRCRVRALARVTRYRSDLR